MRLGDKGKLCSTERNALDIRGKLQEAPHFMGYCLGTYAHLKVKFGGANQLPQVDFFFLTVLVA